MTRINRRPHAPSQLLIVVAFISAICSPLTTAQEPDEVRTDFIDWASRSLHQVADAGLSASTEDLRPLRKMIGDARIVALSEAVHAGAEPLAFRNRLFKYLVEDLGFVAIAVESGIVESHLLNDYVTQGKGDFETVIKQGFSHGFDSFRENRELIRWMREHNAQLPDAARKVQIFGLDVSGSPGNLSVASTPETALEFALEYLHGVDPQAAADMQRRVENFLPVLAGTNEYGSLQSEERDSLTGSIADLISLIERRRFEYIEKSSEDDYEWGERAAVAARQVDTWFRRMPVGWKLSDGLDWNKENLRVRDRLMADNLEWVLNRIESGGRVLVFASVAHIASTPLHLTGDESQGTVPFGAYARTRYGSDFINILNLVVGGEIAYCSANGNGPMVLSPPPADTVEALFASVDVSRYLLDLRRAPPSLSLWLRQAHDHWNGFGSWRFPTTSAFDIAFYVSPVTSACISM